MASALDLFRTVSPLRPQRVQVAPKALSLASALRGGPQAARDLLNQLKGRPGVKAKDLEMWSQVPSTEKLSPLQLVGRAQVPKLYAQRGAPRIGLDEEAAQELATDLIYGPELREERINVLLGYLDDAAGQGLVPDDGLAMMKKARRLRSSDWTPEFLTELEELGENVAQADNGWGMHDIYMDQLGDQALDMAYERPRGAGERFLPGWGEYQRNTKSHVDEVNGGSYFETVLRGAPSYGAKHDLPNLRERHGNYHFDNPAQLGHIRGTIDKFGRHITLDELQSDPAEHLSRKPRELGSIYSLLGQMAVDRAAAADIPRVLFPTAKTIGETRPGRHADFYRKIYDDIIMRDVLKPLQQRGADVSPSDPSSWRGLNAEDYNVLTLSPDLMDAIKRGEGLPGYKKGGLAQCRCQR